jgi:O-antigen ligase
MITTAQTRSARIKSEIIFECLFCVVPPMLLIALGKLVPASYYLFLSVLALLAYHFVKRQAIESVTLVISTTPALMLLRHLFSFTAVNALFVFVFAFYVLSSPEALHRVRRNRLLVGFILFCVLYWLASVILTGDQTSNLRSVELAFAAANVCVLTGRRTYFASALVGIGISAAGIGLAFLPYGARLGTGTVDDYSIGNPITLGLSSALVFILSVADRGRWLLLQSRPVWRGIINAAVGALLILSTSRGSWIVAGVAVIVILLFNKNARTPLLVSIGLLALVLVGLLQTDRGPIVAHFFDQAFAGDESLAKRTTGRADQWKSFPSVFDDSPLWGFGPGFGKQASLRYTTEGKPWHSLYLGIGAEMGLFGLVALALLLGTAIRKGILHYRTCGEMAPLLGVICFMLIGVSVSGIDGTSGLFLGLSLGAADFSGWHRLRAYRAEARSESRSKLAAVNS